MTKTELKALFETGDFPRGEDFAALIDFFLAADLSNFPSVLPQASAENLTNIAQSTTVNEWADVTQAVGYVDTDTCVLATNLTSTFLVGRRVRATIDSGYVYSEVASSSYDGGTNTTTVNLLSTVLNITLSDIDVAVFKPVANGGAVGLGTLGVSGFAASLLDDADAAAARTTLGAASTALASTSAAGLVELATDAEAVAGTPSATLALPVAALRAFLRGCIIPFAGSTTPSWGLECNGQNVSRTTYNALFSIHLNGVGWGQGDGSTTFTIPDLRRRTLVGKGGTGTGTLGNAVSNTGGAETVDISHTHAVGTLSGTFAQTTASAASGSGAFNANSANPTVTISGASAAMSANSTPNNLPPSAVVGYFIVF